MKTIYKNVGLIFKIFLLSHKFDYKITVFEFLHGLCLNIWKVINVVMPAVILNMILSKNAWNTILLVAICYGILQCILSLGEKCFKLLQEAHGFRACNLLRLSMNKKFMRIDYGDTENSEIKDSFEQAKESMWEFCDVGYVIFDDIIGNMITFCCMSYILAEISALSYLIVLFIVLLDVMIQHGKTKFLHNCELKEQVIIKKLDYIAGLMQDYRVGKEIRVFHTQEFMKQKYQEQAEKYISLIKNKENKKKRLSIIQAILHFAQLSIIYLNAIYKVCLNKLPIGSLIMYISSINQLTESVKNLLNSGIELSRVMFYYKDYEKYMNIDENIENSGNEHIFAKNIHILEFKNVFYYYPGSKEPAVKNASFIIKNNQKLGIVGENGSGKSTLIKLMLRLYDPTSGNIYLDGKNIKTYKYSEYLSVFKTVFQDFSIFAYSILENIIFDSEINEKKLTEIIKMVGLDIHIRKYEKGINSKVTKVLDDNGVQLSGGEQQLIAIARTFYHPAKCVVFDEPTAALDARKEAQFFELINDLADGKMAIFCAHRMSSTKFCDNILVMDKGEIIESGNHSDLMIKKGKYYELFENQAGLYKK